MIMKKNNVGKCLCEWSRMKNEGIWWKLIIMSMENEKV